MTNPVEVWNEWSWRHKSTFLPPDILMLHCGAPVGAQIGAIPPIHAAPEKRLGKDYRKCHYGNKRKFLHEPMGIPHTVFHSPQNTPPSCLIKWHLVSIFAWFFSSLHHWEESNLSNWYREFFPAWLEQQTLYWVSFMAVLAISFRSHGKGT